MSAGVKDEADCGSAMTIELRPDELILTPLLEVPISGGNSMEPEVGRL